MDWRRFFTIVLIAGAAMMAFQLISNYLKPHVPPAVGAGGPAAPPPGAFRYPAIPANAPLVGEPGAKPETLQLGTFANGAGDKVAVTVDNVTAGIDLVALNPRDYSEYAKSKKHPKPEPLILLKALPDMPKPYATLGIHITREDNGKKEGHEIPLGPLPAGFPTNAEINAMPPDKRKALVEKALNDDAATIAATNVTILYARQYVWRMQRNKANPNEADLFLTVNDEHGKPLIRVEKIIRVDPASYSVTISHEVENLTDQTIEVSIDQMASIDLPEVMGQTDYRFYHAAGFNTAKHKMDAERYNLLHGSDLRRLAPTDTKEIGSFLGDNPLEWAATSDRFFAAITRPAPETGAPAPVLLYANHHLPVQSHVASANIDVLYGPPKPADAEDCVGGIRLTGSPQEILGHKANEHPVTMSLPLAVYLGPKQPDILQGDINADENLYKNPPVPLTLKQQREYDYAAFDYGKIIQITSSSCGAIYSYCFIDVLAYLLLRVLDFLKATVAFGNYGVAIMILVLLVKAGLHPLTRASQVNMAKMSKKMKDIQPLIEANKKKYAKDKQKQNEEMMRIYRENKVNPAGGLLGCLPMFLQTPIWIAVWAGLSMDINLRHAVFIPGWINDLSAPDATWVFTPFHLPIVGWKISSLNILPLLLGIVVFVQMKVQTASQPKPADAQQANMQKISSYMVLIFPLMLYSWPSGLNLYYFASTLGGLVDTYFVRKSLKRQGILPAGAPVLPTHEEKE